MCTVKEIREAIREDCHSQHGMEFIEIDRVLQTLPFSQGNDLLDRPPIPKRPYHNLAGWYKWVVFDVQPKRANNK